MFNFYHFYLVCNIIIQSLLFLYVFIYVRTCISFKMLINLKYFPRFKDKEDEKYWGILERAQLSESTDESWRALSSELPLSHPHFISASPRFLAAIRAAPWRRGSVFFLFFSSWIMLITGALGIGEEQVVSAKWYTLLSTLAGR